MKLFNEINGNYWIFCIKIWIKLIIRNDWNFLKIKCLIKNSGNYDKKRIYRKIYGKNIRNKKWIGIKYINEFDTKKRRNLEIWRKSDFFWFFDRKI